MIKLLLPILILLSSCTNNTEYKVGRNYVVVSGPFEGCSGKATDYSQRTFGRLQMVFSVLHCRGFSKDNAVVNAPDLREI